MDESKLKRTLKIEFNHNVGKSNFGKYPDVDFNVEKFEKCKIKEQTKLYHFGLKCCKFHC